MTLTTTSQTSSILYIVAAFRKGIEDHETAKSWFMWTDDVDPPTADEWSRGYVPKAGRMTQAIAIQTGAELARALWAKIERRPEMRWVLPRTLAIVPEATGVGLLGMAWVVRE